jgi:hypothetical protein
VNRHFLVPIATALLLVFAFWSYDIICGRRYQLTVDKPTPVLSVSPTEYPTSNPPVTMLQPGQSIKVLRMRYGKDFQTFKIETPSGDICWVVGGEGVRVLSSSQ